MKSNFNLFKIIFLVKILIVANSGNAQNWNQILKTVASDRSANSQFGCSVAISGDFAIVGAYRDSKDVNGANSKNEAGSGYIFRRNGGVWTQQQKLVASDRDADDWFGFSVAISGDYAIIGAYHEDEDASGNKQLNNAGSAYIFKQISGIWTQQKKLVASDRSADDEFGFSVAINGDFVIVGAYLEDEDVKGANTLSGSGSAYIFKLTAGIWVQQQKIVASDRDIDDHFGSKVAINGNFAIIGAPQEDEDLGGGNKLTNSGSAYIFKQNSGVWSQQLKLVAADRAALDNFGYSLDINGDYVIVGAPNQDKDASGANVLANSGAAYIFQQISGVWSQQKKIVAFDRQVSDAFGSRVSIGIDYLIVGASFEDHDVSGANALINSGSAYVFKEVAGTWTHFQKIVAADRTDNDNFGGDVAIDNDYILIGAPNEDEDGNGNNKINEAGSVYIFKLCFGTTGIDLKTACNSFKWIDGKIYTSNNNSAIFTIIGGNKAGCDSIVKLNLTITKLGNLFITNNGKTLTANLSGAKYQWLDCEKSFGIILGEINQNFTPISTGKFAVEITKNSCTDTTSCLDFIVGDVDNTFEPTLKIYPNPICGENKVFLESIFPNSEVEIRDVLGKLIKKYNNGNNKIFEFEFPSIPGIYFVIVKLENKVLIKKVIKN